MHCLTSGLFRREFYDFIRRQFGRRSSSGRTGVVTRMIGPTQLELTQTMTKRQGYECTVETIA